MKGFLKGARWLVSIPFILILFVLTFTGLTATSISQTVTTPSSLKTWFSKGEVYNKVPSLVPEIIVSQAGDKGLGQMPLNKNDLTQISTTVLEPSWVKENIEKVIDAGYLFLEGKTNIPDFQINISERKDILVNKISSQFGSQMPPGGARQLRMELEKNELLSQDTIQSAKLIKIDQKEVNKIQTVYKHIKKLPLYAVGLFTLISLILFLIIPKMKSKLRVLGLTWAVPSLILTALAPFGKNFIRPLYISKIQEAKINNPDLILELVNKPINLAIGAITSKILIYGIILIILGAILFISSYKIKPKS